MLEGRSEDDIQNIATQEQRTFSYETLVAATNNFQALNKLGEGGFGPVYKVDKYKSMNLILAFELVMILCKIV